MTDATLLDHSRQLRAEWEQSVQEQVWQAEQAEREELERDAEKLLEWYRLQSKTEGA